MMKTVATNAHPITNAKRQKPSSDAILRPVNRVTIGIGLAFAVVMVGFTLVNSLFTCIMHSC